MHNFAISAHRNITNANLRVVRSYAKRDEARRYWRVLHLPHEWYILNAEKYFWRYLPWPPPLRLRQRREGVVLRDFNPVSWQHQPRIVRSCVRRYRIEVADLWADYVRWHGLILEIYFSVVTQEYRYRFPGASEFKLLCKPNLEGWRPKAAWAADKSSWQRSVPFLYSIVSSTLGNSNAEVGWSVLEFSGFTDQSFIQSILLSFSTIVTVVIREIWTLTGSPPRSPRSLYQNVSMMFHQCILCSEVFGEIWCLKWRAILFFNFLTSWKGEKRFDTAFHLLDPAIVSTW